MEKRRRKKKALRERNYLLPLREKMFPCFLVNFQGERMNIIRMKVVCKFHRIRVERNNDDIRTEAEEINAFKCSAEEK